MKARLQTGSWLALESGSLVFLPFLALYLLSWAAAIPSTALRPLFWAMDACLLAILIPELLRRLGRLGGSDKVFWGLLVLLLLIPGAFLEYPSDPWEHYNRYFLWNDYSIIADYPVRQRFEYYWGWTLIGWIPIAGRRFALGIYGALWQLLVLYQLFVLLLALGVEKRMAKWSVLAFCLAFGTSVFGLRYYALSSLMMAYAAYLFALRTLVVPSSSPWRILVLASCAVLIAANHPEELLFLGALGLSLGLYRLFERRKKLAAAFRAVCGTLLAGGLLPILMGKETVVRIATRGAELAGPAYRDNLQAGAASLTPLMGFDLFHKHNPYVYGTLGAIGLVCLLLSFRLIRRLPLLVWLAWTPVLLLLYPPFTLTFLAATEASNTYRMLYAFPACLLLPLLLEPLLGRIRAPDWAMGVAIVLLCLPLHRYWGGRAYTQLFNPDPTLSFPGIESVSAWVHRLPHRCWVLTDQATGQMAVLADSKFPSVELGANRERRLPDSLLTQASLPMFDRTGLQERSFCAIIVPKPGAAERLPLSRLAEASRHWAPDLARKALSVTPSVRSSVEQIARRQGMSHPDVHPDYDVYAWDDLISAYSRDSGLR